MAGPGVTAGARQISLPLEELLLPLLLALQETTLLTCLTKVHTCNSPPNTQCNPRGVAPPQLNNGLNIISGRMISSGISGVAIASVHFEKTRLKKLIISNIEKRDVGIAKHFSRKYGNKAWAFDYPVSAS